MGFVAHQLGPGTLLAEVPGPVFRWSISHAAQDVGRGVQYGHGRLGRDALIRFFHELHARDNRFQGLLLAEAVEGGVGFNVRRIDGLRVTGDQALRDALEDVVE